MTDKLYLQDAYLREFSAVILASRQTDIGWEVVLDRTAFYPEGGGQPFDTGEINGIPVTAVYERAEQIVHVLPRLPKEKNVVGKLNWPRRFYHMQQHSGQHILSAVFEDMYQAATIGFHLGSEVTQIDLTLAEITPQQVQAVETAVNTHIYANLPIRAITVQGENLSQYPVRKLPAKDFAQLRLVISEGLDCCPCGGTHVRSTGEIGIIKILNWEKKNNAVRVSFVCGERALADYQLKHRLIQELSAKLSSPVNELAEAFSQRMAKADLLAKELAAARMELLKLQAAALLQTTPPQKGVHFIAHVLEAAQPNEAAQLAKALTASDPAVALVAAISPDGAKAHLVFATNTENYDMNKLLKQALTALNGKGGGNARLAQGGTNKPSDVHELLNKLLQDITE